MPQSDQDLIQRLQQRNADRQRATTAGIHPPQAIPTVTAKGLEAFERAIGFKLPELLRALYLNVGNGGFGPEYGIVGIEGGATLDGCTLETCYQNRIELESQNSVWRWPKQLLPLANWGNSFWDQGSSLDRWLEVWLADDQEPEPKWPSDSWMNKSLGFTLPT